MGETQSRGQGVTEVVGRLVGVPPLTPLTQCCCDICCRTVRYGWLGAWYGRVWLGAGYGRVWLGERRYAPLPSSSQLIRLRGPAELPEYIYVGITEPSLHASL